MNGEETFFFRRQNCLLPKMFCFLILITFKHIHSLIKVTYLICLEYSKRYSAINLKVVSISLDQRFFHEKITK